MVLSKHKRRHYMVCTKKLKNKKRFRMLFYPRIQNGSMGNISLNQPFKTDDIQLEFFKMMH